MPESGRRASEVLLTFARLYTDDLDGLLAGLALLGQGEPRQRFALELVEWTASQWPTYDNS